MQAKETSLRSRRGLIRGIVAVIALLLLLIFVLMWWWDTEPRLFDPVKVTQQQMNQPVSTGDTTTVTLITSVRTLLDKRGGYLSNDKLPPGVFMDNLPNWEFGSLTASRDMVRFLRNDFSRSQAQSTEDKDLAEADPLLNSPNDRCCCPARRASTARRSNI